MTAPLRRFAEPSPHYSVVITIEYTIREADVVAFLEVMAERRRVRRRDGARHWTLLRDLENPEIWIERYHNPTWLDYVRHNQRITQADAAVGERLRELHQGPGRPRVRRLIERQTGWPASDPGSQARDIADPLTDPTRSA
jgi:hypothetical protein